MRYIVQFFDPQILGLVRKEESQVSVSVEADDVLQAITRAEHRLDCLPEKKGWKVLAVGPQQAADSEWRE